MKSVHASLAMTALCSAAMGAPPGYHDAVAADEPSLWYRFSEPDGSAEAINYGSLGEAFDGIFYNGVGLEAGTPAGDDAACFMAANQQYVESKGVAPKKFLGNPSFTAEAVVRLFDAAQWPNYAPFLHWGEGGTGREVYFSMWYSSGNRAYAGFYNGGMRMTGAFGVGQWVHIVWIRDSDGGANNERTGTRLFVNGEEVEIQVDDVLCCSFVPDVLPTTFRVQRARDYTRYFSGDIDEVALYDRMLTPGEVLEHYEALVGPAPCYADVNGDGVLDLFDFLAFVNLFNAKDATADCDPNACDPMLDLFDFLCFVNTFNAGCP